MSNEENGAAWDGSAKAASAADATMQGIFMLPPRVCETILLPDRRPPQQRKRVDRATGRVDAVVQVRRRPPRVSGRADVPQHVARLHPSSRKAGTERIEVREVMHLAARAEHAHDVAAEPVLAHAEHHA